MGVLKNRIDFVAFVSVCNANPNGDPLMGNMPRMDRNNHGEISPECIKRKLRNRLQAMGHPICVVSNDKATDGFTDIQSRVVDAVGKKDKTTTPLQYGQAVCKKFMDTRCFGGVFAWGKKENDGPGDSIPVLGAVSINLAKSLDPVIINSMQITKSVNGTPSEKARGSDTMGMRHMVEFGVYRVEGSISVSAAARTGMTDEDAEVLKECLRTLFRDDESSARPAGSMEVLKVYWFEHNGAGGPSVARVFRSVHAVRGNCCGLPTSVNDYTFSVDDIPGIVLTEIDGE